MINTDLASRDRSKFWGAIWTIGLFNIYPGYITGKIGWFTLIVEVLE